MGKLASEHNMQMYEKDNAILDEFASNPQEYIERDGNLAIDVKNLYK